MYEMVRYVKFRDSIAYHEDNESPSYLDEEN